MGVTSVNYVTVYKVFGARDEFTSRLQLLHYTNEMNEMRWIAIWNAKK